MSDSTPSLDRRVTAVILTHNRRQEVAATVARMRALDERVPLIVVDNASHDGTAAYLAECFPGLRVIRLERNLGAAARNAGIHAARTPYVALCDDDTWWAPGSLTRAADLLDAHPHLAIVTGMVLVGPEAREDPTCRDMARSPLTDSRPLPGPPVLGFMAGACMLRRDAFLSVGGFEPRFFLGGEESLAAVDLAASGWAIAYVEQVRIHHHPSRQRDGRARRNFLVRNALWFTWLRRPLPSALRRTLDVLRSAWRQGTGMRGVLDAMMGMPWVLRARRVVPPELERQLRRLEKAP